jgi:ferredoxin
MGLMAALAAGVFPFLGKDAVVESSCSHCGLCVKQCPAGNIILKNGKIKFHSSCSACLRCVYSCPKQAIRFRLFRFIKIQEGYNVKRSLSEAGNLCEKPNGIIPPFFPEYIKDSQSVL